MKDMISNIMKSIINSEGGLFSPEAENKRYQDWLKKHNVNNPEDPRHFYDYRAAYEAGATPDKKGHWPSEYKDDLHPNRFIKTEDGWFDTKYNRSAAEREVLQQSSLFDQYLLEQERIGDWYNKSEMYGN
jgi:hypothetical protein